MTVETFQLVTISVGVVGIIAGGICSNLLVQAMSWGFLVAALLIGVVSISDD